MKNKIAILTSGHSPFDERIFNKFGSSFIKNNYKVKIISSKKNLTGVFNSIYVESFDDNNLSKREKINKFFTIVSDYTPSLIICCEPITCIAAYKYKRINRSCKLIYDVTELYPENITLKLRGLIKITTYIQLFILNFIASNLVDSIIVGEVIKKSRYDFFAPLKNKIIISHFPVLSLFNFSLNKLSKNKLTFCFAGLLTKERGFFRFLNFINDFSFCFNEVKLTIKIIGRFLNDDDENEFKSVKEKNKSVNFIFINWLSYEEISNNLQDVDICFDLREQNYFFNNSLPIKLFEFMACGKPVIYSDLKSIRNEFVKIDFGFLVDPNNNEEISECIEKYILNENLYYEHSQNARKYIDEKFNWENEEQKLLKFIAETLNN